MNILLIEDDTVAIDTCIEAAENYNKDKPDSEKISILPVKTIKETRNVLLENYIDMAIVDITLKSDENGNDIIKSFNDLFLRIPSVIHTGTPDAARENVVLKVIKRGEESYEDIFNYLRDVEKTGITKILGKNGILEKNLSNIFQRNLIPTLKDSNWLKYGERDPEKTEKALLRYTISHLQQILDEEAYYPEEMYIYPTTDKNLRTGNILKLKNEEKFYIVLSPACDLVLRTQPDSTQKMNTDSILLVEIETIEAEIKTNPKEIVEIRKNKKLCHHYLHKIGAFAGGQINFRKVKSITSDYFKSNYIHTEIQVSPSFCKDIVSRFSSYYARQGQPDIDFEE